MAVATAGAMTRVLPAIAITLAACSSSGAPAATTSPDAQGSACVAVPDGDGSTTTTQRITIRAALGAVSPVLLGANVNKFYDAAQGLWDPANGVPTADSTTKAKRAHLGLLRWPGGTDANLFRWKRSVGPRAQRRCQYDPSSEVGRLERDYGPTEWGALLDAVGAEGQVMVPFAAITPGEAADLVEYMNAPVGTNPNGGIAWADVRAADGAPSPLGITRWELGNELDRGGEGYWMAQAGGSITVAQMEQRRIGQYIDGDDFAVTDQAMYRGCDPANTTSDGAASQSFYLRWGLIKGGSTPTVKVGGVAWTAVADLTSQSATAQVYELDRADGSVRFGDGVHGKIPPTGQTVTMTYQLHHAGFVAIYDAMKAAAAQIGTPIDVCSTWAPVDPRGTAEASLGAPSFAQTMAARGMADHYDCVVIHPYTSFDRDFTAPWTTARDAHEDMMLGDVFAGAMVHHLVADVTAHGTAGSDGRAPYVAISEFGALWFGDSTDAQTSRVAVRQASYMTSHVLYMASQWLRFARDGLSWVEGNDLVAEPTSMRGVFGGHDTGFIYSAEAMAREALAPAFADGATWLAADIAGNQLVGIGEKYSTLVAGASRDANGMVRVIVVNRSTEATTAVIDPGALRHGSTIDVTTVAGDRFDSAVGGVGDNTVATRHSSLEVDTQVFATALAPASVTIFAWAPCP